MASPNVGVKAPLKAEDLSEALTDSATLARKGSPIAPLRGVTSLALGLACMEPSAKRDAQCPVCGAPMRACAHTRSRSRPRQLPVNPILVGDALINAIGRLLETNGGQAFCRLCLVRVLQADHHNVSKALTVLQLNPYYGLDARTCSVCHQPRVTIRLRQQGE
jgi:hypothetical protein